MKLEHKAIIQCAQRDGLLPSQYAAELVDYDMTQAMWTQMLKYEVAPKKLSEAQQDAVLAELQDASKKISTNVVETIAAAGTKAVRMQLKDLKISNGQLVGVVSGDDPNFNELISKVQDKSSVILVLYEMDYHQAMDGIQSEKDQKPLDLEDQPETKPTKGAKAPRVSSPTSAAALAKKATELPEKLVADAKEYILRNNIATVAALQNGLHIGAEKGEALMARLEADGAVTKPDSDGNRAVVKAASPVLFDADTLDVMYSTACREVIKAASADDSVLRPIYGDDDNLIEQALMQMEEDGIVSPPSPEGLRDVLTLPV